MELQKIIKIIKILAYGMQKGNNLAVFCMIE